MSGRGLDDLGPMPSPASELAHQQILAQAAAGLFGAEEELVYVGRYVLESPIGAGAMGEVFRARDPELQRTVALKLLHASLVESDSQLRERSRREALALARVDHPNVVEVFEVGEYAGRPFVAMEFIEGQTLSAWVEQREPSWREIVAVYVAAGRGLAAAHRAGLVHRDFKPDNVLVSGAGSERRVRVLDFGLARLAKAELELYETGADLRPDLPQHAELTQAGARLGTPAFMAPEQLRGELADAASDQFSFCLALYRALWKVDPFPSERASERLEAMERNAARPPSAGLTSAARGLWPLLRRGLSGARSERWPELPALLDALERAASTRWRRRALASAALVVGMGMGFGLGSTPAPDEAELAAERERERVEQLAICELEARALDEVWTPATREKLRASFLASGHPGAAESWARARAQLDDYARGWSSVRERVCVEAKVEDKRNPDSLTRAQACLEEAAVSLQLRLDALAQLDERGLSHALELVFMLPSADACADPSHARAQPGEELDPARLRALRARIEHVDVLRELARFADAKADAQPLLAEAEALAWAPATAEVRHALGRLAFATSDYEGAEQHFIFAYELALSSHDDELALRAATRLMWTVGVAARRFDEGRLWARHAAALLTRLELTDTVHEAAFLTVRGVLSKDRNERLERLERAVKMWHATLGEDHPRLAEALKYRSRVLVELGREAEALAFLERALEIQERSLGPHHPHLARTLIHLAEVERKRGHYDAAAAALERAHSIQRHAFGDDHEELLETESAQVRLLRARDQLDAAASLAASIAERQAALSGPSSIAYCIALRAWAEIEHEREHLESTHELFERTEACFRTRPDNDVWAWIIIQQRARLALARGKTELAVSHYQRALDQTQGEQGRLLQTLHELVPLIEGARLRALVPQLEWALDQGDALDAFDGAPVLRFGLARALGPRSPRARELADQARNQVLNLPDQARLLATMDLWLKTYE